MSNIQRVEEDPKPWWTPGSREIRFKHKETGYTLAVVIRLKAAGVRINTTSFASITIAEAEDIHRAIGRAINEAKKMEAELKKESEKAIDNASQQA